MPMQRRAVRRYALGGYLLFTLVSKRVNSARTKEDRMTQERDPNMPASAYGATSTSQSTSMDGGSMPQSGAMSGGSESGGMASNVKEKASEMGSKVQDQAEVGKDKAADGLEKAAEQMRTRLESQGGPQAQVGVKVADGMEKTAGYLREHEAAEIWSDVESFVKEHPMQAAATAAVAGFVIARILR